MVESGCSMIGQGEIWLKTISSRSKYWGWGPTITVLEPSYYKDEKHRYWCMTDHDYDCDHVRQVRAYLLQGEPPVLDR